MSRNSTSPWCVAVIVFALAWATLPASALADGDPASDVLATQSVFLPQDASIPIAQQRQIAALLSAAARSGYRLRVAIVASATDLGSVSALWRRPESYASFLGQELSLVYRGGLLVVMPNGYGLYPGAGRAAPARSAITGLAAPGAALGSASLRAIELLASAAGHRLAVPRATEPSTSSQTDVLAWTVFLAGAVLIVVSWTISIRVRPLRRPRSQGWLRRGTY